MVRISLVTSEDFCYLLTFAPDESSGVSEAAKCPDNGGPDPRVQHHVDTGVDGGVEERDVERDLGKQETCHTGYCHYEKTIESMGLPPRTD